jgi:hypothetical protein
MSLVLTIEAGIFLCLGTLGFVAGAFAQRFGASGDRALKLSAGVALFLLLAVRRGYGDPLLILGLSICSFGAPVALAYGFHARRNAPERRLAWAGFILSIIAFVFFVFWMIASALNLGVALGLWK